MKVWLTQSQAPAETSLVTDRAGPINLEQDT